LSNFELVLTHLTHHHPQPLLGKEGSTHYRRRQDTPLLTKEGLGVVVLTVRKVSSKFDNLQKVVKS